jgi:hypothetical protein
MTDKQIIIDGVEVNECAYFLYPLGCNSLDSKTCQCINDDCYYKQFKRVEQKLEKIKELLTTCKANSDILCCECKFSSQCEEQDTDTQILKIIEE